jgi:hypothetical protein
MRIPIKFYIPVLLLLSVVACAAAYVHWTVTSDKSKTLEFSAALIGGLAAVYGLLQSVQQRRAALAARFIERWNSPDFAPYQAVVRRTIDAKSPPTAEPHLTAFMLNFWEEVAVAVHAKEADERLLKQFFYTTVLTYYAACRGYITGIQRDLNQPTAFVEFTRLARRWSPGGVADD